MNDLKIITADGEKIEFSTLTKDVLAQTSDEAIAELAHYLKRVTALAKNVDAEVKGRLDDGKKLNGISYTKRTKQTLPQSIENKNAFVKKYGIAAFDIKSPTQLKKVFGEQIEDDLSKVVVLEEGKSIKYE